MNRNNRIITRGPETTKLVLNALEEIALTVGTTLGPYGRNVFLDNFYTEPTVTNDGITVLQEIFYADRIKNMVAAMVKRTSQNTNRQAGDGTTTTAILAWALAKEGSKFLDKGVNPFKLTESMNRLGRAVVDVIKQNSQAISSNEDLIRVATISSQDENVGKIIGEAFAKVGDGGSVAVEDSTELGVKIEMKTGLEFEEPIKSEYFFNSPRYQYESENCRVLVTDKKLVSINQIKGVLDEMIMKGERDIFFICDDMDPSMVAALIANKMKGILNVGVVKAPEYGVKKENFFTDVCALTGATLISDTTGVQPKDVMLDHLGVAEKLISSRWSTLIVGGKKNEEAIEKIVTFLKDELKRITDDRIRRKTEERLAKLTGGIATIKVGYPTKMETENKRHKIEDAVRATKSAIQEGIIYGSGVSLLEAIREIPQEVVPTPLEDKIARDIFQKALAYPLRMIMDNAGLSGEYIVEATRAITAKGHGFNIKTMAICDLMKEGIIDPVKVIRVSLENAISLANMILSSNAIITEDPEVDDTDFKAE